MMSSSLRVVVYNGPELPPKINTRGLLKQSRQHVYSHHNAALAFVGMKIELSVHTDAKPTLSLPSST